MLQASATRFRSLAAISILTALGLAATSPSESRSLAVINVQVIGLRNDKGVMKAALYDSETGWKSDNKNKATGAIQRQEGAIRQGTATISFTGVPYGTYAIKGFHDEDRSGKLYTGLFGIPKVAIIYSNNAPIWAGPALFSKASFKVDKPIVSLVLRAQKI